MNARFLLLLLLPLPAFAQGFAGLGETAEDFAAVTAPAALEFPADHGPHPEFRIEWWYLTAALTGEDGRSYGAQWTLFRQALEPGPQREGFASQQVWMAHAAVTTPETHRFAERVARGGIGQAGVELEPFRAWIDDWRMMSEGHGIRTMRVKAGDDDFTIDLRVSADGPLVLHGAKGFSLKADAGQASYYYSQPFYRVAGTLMIEGEAVAVSGTGWLDREWSSQHMSPEQEGWDWFSLHLEDGQRLMAYRLRVDGGGKAFGTWIAPDGSARSLWPGEVNMEPREMAEVAGREIPVEWHIAVPDEGVAVDIRAVNAQSWMGTTFAYWEGPVSVAGSHAGRGYLEMTGYE